MYRWPLRKFYPRLDIPASIVVRFWRLKMAVATIELLRSAPRNKRSFLSSSYLPAIFENYWWNCTTIGSLTLKPIATCRLHSIKKHILCQCLPLYHTNKQSQQLFVSITKIQLRRSSLISPETRRVAEFWHFSPVAWNFLHIQLPLPGPRSNDYLSAPRTNASERSGTRNLRVNLSK